MPKIAITGKGGVGKTTLTALLSHVYAQRGQDVIAIDADPAGNLGLAFGLPAALDAQLKPIAEMEELIYERTGRPTGHRGRLVQAEPQGRDIPESFSIRHQGVRLLASGHGARRRGRLPVPGECPAQGAGDPPAAAPQPDPACSTWRPASSTWGEATAGSVDAFIIVVEPGLRSLGTAAQIRDLADRNRRQAHLPGGQQDAWPARRGFHPRARSRIPLLGSLPFSMAAVSADQEGVAVFDQAPELLAIAEKIAGALAIE